MVVGGSQAFAQIVGAGCGRIFRRGARRDASLKYFHAGIGIGIEKERYRIAVLDRDRDAVRR
jgi:hypothetical protein